MDEERVDPSKIKAVGQFLASDDKVLVCTHATFRFAVEQLGVAAFDDRLIAVDEFHHFSASADNRLGGHLSDLIARDRTHIVAMTGSYFRGDAVPVLTPEDKAKFETVTYTYHEQLDGCEHLKALHIGYYFYSGRYLSAIEAVLDPARKTIVHLPSVNARESTKDKVKEVEEIMEALGEWRGADPATGFHRVALRDGRVLKIADLVDDSDPARRGKVLAALKDPAHKHGRDHVDIILALGMAKEGFDWIWCEHALTVGYRSSLTEIVQIIGRATRDAPVKPTASFTNLIAEPDASEAAVVGAINDTLKAIAASLRLEQVLAPRFTFTPRDTGPIADFDYGPAGYREGETNVGVREDAGQYHIELKGLVEPKTDEAQRICREDLTDVVTQFVQNRGGLEQGLFNEDVMPQELTHLKMCKIVRDRYPELSDEDQEAIRQQAIAALTLTQKAKEAVTKPGSVADGDDAVGTALIDGIRKFATDVRDLDIDLIDSINPFEAAYSILAKAMDESVLKQVQSVISAKKVKISPEEARELAHRALRFKQERGRLPEITAQDAWEQRLAEGVAALARYRAQATADG